jgi:hypothetical protein
MKTIIALALILSAPLAYSYTFTSSEGSTFEGQLLRVEESQVTILRHADRKEFSIPKSRFIEADQEYFARWAKENPHLNFPGRGVSQISLRCTTARTNDESIIRETGRTFIDIDVSNSVYWDYHWLTVETTVTATARPETEKVRLKGATVHVRGSSVSGPVYTRIYTAFFVKSGGAPRIFRLDEKNVMVDRGHGEFFVSCDPIENYYGYGTLAMNLATGKMIGVAGSNHSIKQILEQKGRSGDF